MVLTKSWLRWVRGSSGLVFTLILLALLSTPALAQNTASDAAVIAAGQAQRATVDLSQLADILDNDAARAQLIATLRSAASDNLKQSPAEPLTVAQTDQSQAAPTQPADPPTEQSSAVPAVSAQDQGHISPARRLALATSGWAEQITANASTMWQAVVTLWTTPGAGQSMHAFDAAVFWNALIKFVLV